MPERGNYAMEQIPEHSPERDVLLLRAVELEKELMRARRVEKVLLEMEQRYLSLMDSAVFLHVLLSPSGGLRLMNRRAEEFFGFHLNIGSEVTLHSLVSPGYGEDLDALLREASERPVHITLPTPRSDGPPGWLDLELSASSYQGDLALQMIAIEVTGLIKGKPSADLARGSQEDSSTALIIMNSCPGLLCFAVDKNGTLIYSTRGYREVAKRFMGHECISGTPYPAGLSTGFDMELYELLQEAFLGETNMTSLIEQRDDGDNHWNMTTAPLLSTQGDVLGAVAHLSPQAKRQRPLEPAMLPAADLFRPAPQPAPSAPGVSLREALDTFPGLFVLLDEEGRCVEVGESFVATLRLKREEVQGRKFAELALENDPVNEDLARKIERVVRDRSPEELEAKFCTKDGEIFHLVLKSAPLSVPWTERGVLFACTDNTRLKRTEEQLKRVSTTDTSTGILNRQGLERILYTEIDRAARYRGSLSVIMLDVDGFRLLNERIGYASSDRVLKELASLLKGRIRSTDFLGRWGGDEFMILTPCPLALAWQLGEQLRDMTRHNAFSENVKLTLSAGIAEFKKNMDVSSFVACAYDAMTEAKRSGGNRSVQARHEESQERLEASE